MLISMTRTALVTGGSRGLGAAMATVLAESRYCFAVNSFANAERAERLCASLRDRNLIAHPFRADVRDATAIARLVREVEAALGPIDIAVLNATGPQPVLSIEEQTFAAYLDPLVYFCQSPLLVLQALLPGMRVRGFGRIIQIGSEVVEVGKPRFANYVAAKAAQLGQTRSCARELAAFGITVNLVAPGWSDRSATPTIPWPISSHMPVRFPWAEWASRKRSRAPSPFLPRMPPRSSPAKRYQSMAATRCNDSRRGAGTGYLLRPGVYRVGRYVR